MNGQIVTALANASEHGRTFADGLRHISMGPPDGLEFNEAVSWFRDRKRWRLKLAGYVRPSRKFSRSNKRRRARRAAARAVRS